jgi:uncharacterized membrane protein YbhN (UPF0104 family)
MAGGAGAGGIEVKRWMRWLALALGVGLFVGYVRGMDLGAVVTQIRGLGWTALLLPIPYFVVYLVDAWAWRSAFAIPPAIPFVTLLRIRWCGESVNNLVPTAYVGGEALKVVLLSRHGVSPKTGTTAALVSKTAQTVAQVLFLAVGSAAFLTCGGGHAGLQAAMATVLGGGLTAVGLLFWWQRRGVFGSLLRLLDRLRIRSQRLESKRARLLETDRAISEFYGTHRARFLVSTAWYFAGWMLDSVEIWLTAWLLGMPIHGFQALAVEAFVGVVKVVGMWVPGALGVQESGIVALVRLAGGADLLGATYALLRRVRELLFAAVGWGLFLAGGAPPREGSGSGSDSVSPASWPSDAGGSASIGPTHPRA